MIYDKFKVVITMNDEMLRLSLIELMNKDLLNNFINEIFNYHLREGEYVYMQYKIVSDNIVINIYDNSNSNCFKAYIFTNDDIDNDMKDVYYINVNCCYEKYRNKGTKNKLDLLGALLKEQDNDEKKRIINYIDNDCMKNILLKHFTV